MDVPQVKYRRDLRKYHGFRIGHQSTDTSHGAGFWTAIAWCCISACLILLCATGPESLAATKKRAVKEGANLASAGAGKSSKNLPSLAEESGKPNFYKVPLVITSEFSDADVVPDGNLGKKLWSTAKRVRFDEAAFSRTKYPRAETMVASRWTTKYLYLAFWCHYQHLNTYQGENQIPERWGLWDRDVAEVFINPQPEHTSHYYEFEIAPNNQWLDLEIDLNRNPFNESKWNSGFEHATRIDPVRHIWTAEMRIPLGSMNVQHLRPNAEWKLNFYRNDGPSGPARRKLSWGPVPLKVPVLFHQPASFGTIRFAAPHQ